MSNIVPFAEMQTMALSVTKSGMFGLKSPEQAVTLMLIAQAENIHPIQAVQMYSVINGMPSLKSTEVQARFQRAGGKVNWKDTTDKKAVCRLEIDGQSYVSEYTIQMATQMGLASKDNWKKMPKAMLMARAVSSGVRALYPSCLNNMYSVEEAMDIPSPNDMPTIELVEDTEIIEPPKRTVASLKSSLATKLKGEGFNNADMKVFFKDNDLENNVELLREIVKSDEKLIELVIKFEEEISK